MQQSYPLINPISANSLIIRYPTYITATPPRISHSTPSKTLLEIGLSVIGDAASHLTMSCKVRRLQTARNEGKNELERSAKVLGLGRPHRRIPVYGRISRNANPHFFLLASIVGRRSRFCCRAFSRPRKKRLRNVGPHEATSSGGILFLALVLGWSNGFLALCNYLFRPNFHRCKKLLWTLMTCSSRFSVSTT